MAKTMQHSTCPLCKHRDSNLPNFPLHRYCSRCELAWLKHFPNATYEETYYTGASTIASLLFVPLSLLFHFIRNSYVGFTKKKLWIDVGAGDGQFLQTVRAYRKIGVDISAAARKIMKEKGLTTMTDLQFLRARNLQADVISFWHMLEHVSNPWDFLTAARNNLTNTGLIVIGIPSIDCLEYRFFKQSWFHTPKFHLFENSPRSMRILLEKTGFEIRSIDYWSIEHHLPNVLQSLINVTAGSQGALHRFIRRGHDRAFRKKDALWSIFWMTIGAPFVFALWIAGAILHKSSTIVIVASKKNF